MDDILSTLRVSASGMRSQGTRLRVIAENLANAETTATAPGGDAYRRRTITFKATLDQETGARMVSVNTIRPDSSPLPRVHDPAHPAADADGYVSKSNVNSLIELADMREAQRTYEANLNVIKSARAMLQDTIDILR